MIAKKKIFWQKLFSFQGKFSFSYKQYNKFLIILGCDIQQIPIGFEYEPSQELKDRLDRAKLFLEKQDYFDKLDQEQHVILCAGKGKLLYPEAQVMRDYLAQFFQEYYIIKEQKSQNTVQNAFLSFLRILEFRQNVYETLENEKERSQMKMNKVDIEIDVCTSDYHIKRSQIIFEKTQSIFAQQYPDINFQLKNFISSSTENKNPETDIQFSSIDVKLKKIQAEVWGIKSNSQ